MGSAASHSSHASQQPEDPRAPLAGNQASNALLFPGGGAAAADLTPTAPPGNAIHSDQDAVCAVCIGPMAMAPPFQLPACGHTFHGVCIGSALQVTKLCPLCRCSVSDDTATAVIAQLAADTGDGALTLGIPAEILADLQKHGRTPESTIAEETVIAGLQHAATCKGDHEKIPAIAALLGRGAGAVARTRQTDAVRLAAVQALRAIVPTFSADWVGQTHVLDLLRSIALTDSFEEVRCAAIQAISEVGVKGDATDLTMLRNIIEDRTTKPDVRLFAANAVCALAVRGDQCSREAAMAAFIFRDSGVRSVGYTALRQHFTARGECPELVADLAGVAATHCDAEARAAALELIGCTEAQSGELGIAAATAQLKDPEESVREAALAALRSLWAKGDPRAVETLNSLISGGTDDVQLRVTALGMLPNVAQRGDSAAASAAALALSDAEDAVRLAAATELRRLCERGDPQVVSLLMGQIRHREEDVQMLVIEALGYVANRGDTEVAAALRELCRGSGDETAYAAEQALKRLQ